jgi:hypothetical protein
MRYGNDPYLIEEVEGLTICRTTTTVAKNRDLRSLDC